MLAASMSDASMSAGSEVHARAEKRVHGALAVRGHEDEATGGWLALIGRRRVVGDAERADVVAEDAAELIGSDPADEAAFRPERGKSGDGVGGGASGALDGRAHGLIEPPASPAGIRRMKPLARSCLERKASSQRAMMSTMALPMPTTS